MIKHAQGEFNFKQGITSKRAGGNGEAIKGDEEALNLKGNIKALKDDKGGIKVRMGVLKGGMEGSTGRRGSGKW